MNSIDRDVLVARYLDGALSEAELAQMRDAAGNPDVVDSLVRQAVVDDLLSRHAESSRGVEQARWLASVLTSGTGVKSSAGDRFAVTKKRRDDPASRKRLAYLVGLVAMTAAAAVIGWVGTIGRVEKRDTPRLTPVAGRFSRSMNVEWTAEAKRWSVGDSLREGDLVELAAGRVELVFDSGAVMTLVGPAGLEVRSAAAAALRMGTATTRVENEDGGEFRVLTASTDVVDLGTEFGVRIDPTGNTEVVVFDGAVDLRPVLKPRGEEYPARRLSVGEAVRAGEAGTFERLVAVVSDAFPRGDEMFQVARARPPAIVGISDDRRSAASPKYYRIHHEGLVEDARAFVDRDFEWNGIGPEGIPAFLRGADYVATFNNDKEEEISPSITVELSMPAMLYVLYDDRMLVPGWLSEAFEDTGFDLGLDEGKPRPVKPERGSRPNKGALGVGAGQSIDRICSIWRLRVERTGALRLGPIGAEINPQPDGFKRRTMFGIAAQPL